MTNQQKGSLRDRQLLSVVEKCKALDTDQVVSLLFSGISSGRRVAQRRLTTLHGKGKLKRVRLSLEEPYIYYVASRPGQLEHVIATNWVYVSVVRSLANWERLTTWQYAPQDYKIIVPDAFYGIYNTVTQEYRYAFVEVDLSENDWDKTRKYNTLYSEAMYRGLDWVATAKTFPQIICVTNSEKRQRHIIRSFDRDNTNNLQFDVKLLATYERRVRKCKRLPESYSQDQPSS